MLGVAYYNTEAYKSPGDFFSPCSLIILHYGKAPPCFLDSFTVQAGPPQDLIN